MKTATRKIKCDRIDVSEGQDRVCLFQDGHKVTCIANSLDSRQQSTVTRRVTVLQLAQMIRALPDTDQLLRGNTPGTSGDSRLGQPVESSEAPNRDGRKV